MRRFVAMLIALCALVPLTSGHTVLADESDAQQAAREIADARERANAATDAYFAAESVFDSLEVDAQELEAVIADLQTQVAALRDRVQQVAVNRFTRSSSAASPFLNGFSSAEELMLVSALTEVITDTSESDFDNFDSLNLDLDKKNDELVAKHAETEAQQANAIVLRDEVRAEIENLKVVEAQRLKDDAVRKALAAEERTRAAKVAQPAAQQESAPVSTIVDDDIDAPSLIPDNSAIAAERGSGGQTGGGGSGGRRGVRAEKTTAGWTGCARPGMRQSGSATRGVHRAVVGVGTRALT